MNSEEDEPVTIGWDAISEHCDGIYGGQEPHHYATILKAMFGGADPLDGISVYRNNDPLPHFHYVTYGFSELYDKDSDDPDVSGFGFEMTFRLATSELDQEPPTWPCSMLQNLARYVFSSGNAFDNNHHLPLNGPICAGAETEITCAAIQLDPQFGEISTPHGLVKFLQLVGLTVDEYELIKQGYHGVVVEQLKSLDSIMVTDLSRASMLTDEKFVALIDAAEPEVNHNESFGTHVEFESNHGKLHLRIGATRVTAMVQMMQKVLKTDRPIAIYGNHVGFSMWIDESNSFNLEDEWLELRLTESTLAEITEALKPKRDVHEIESFPELTIEIIPVDIRDNNGNVSETVG